MLWEDKLNRLVFHFLTNGKVVNGDPSNNVGLQNMIGWSIVNQRMLHFACTVIFFSEPSKPEKFRSDVFAKKKVMRNVKRLWKVLTSKLPASLTTMQL